MQNTKNNFISKEAMALRQVRIYKKITREQAAEAAGVCSESIYRYENGRSKLTEVTKKKLLRRYKMTHEDFGKVLSGKTELPVLSARSVHYKGKIDNYKKRFNQKILSKEHRVLKILRKMAKLSQSEAAQRCGCHRKLIGFIENGRINMTDDRIKKMVKAYAFTMGEFYELLEQDILRDEVIEECTKILETIEINNLKAVRALLVNFM